ncbi:MAG: helix-turn-helix domain-containing protein [Fimbriimonadales bacterium]|nr:helix-turn-helix domain-containing protein [Fimbriimonadales bacterium]
MRIEKVLGELLYEIRRVRGYTREQVAQVTGLSLQSVGRIERGDVIAPWTSVWAMVKFYGIDFDELIRTAEEELESEREKYHSFRRSLRRLGIQDDDGE